MIGTIKWEGDARYTTAPGCREMAAEFLQNAVTAETTAMGVCWLGKARALLSRAANIEKQATTKQGDEA